MNDQSRSFERFNRHPDIVEPTLPGLDLHVGNLLGAVVAGEFLRGNERSEMKILKSPTANYIGRIEFGSGNISAEDVSKPEFEDVLKTVKEECLLLAPDMRQVYGNCMDGRGDVKTAIGSKVEARPKVIGGPSLFGWLVASYGQFEIIKGITEPIEQFRVVNQQLVKAGMKLGMHFVCGMAGGVEPVSGKYLDNFDEILGLSGQEAQEASQLKSGRYLKELKTGINKTVDSVQVASTDFNEAAMIEVVQELGGLEAVVHVDVDHDHPNHGHDEIGVVLSRVEEAIVDKNKVIELTGKMLFYQNIQYAKTITRAMARSQQELVKGIIISDQLPIAGSATLGRGQHVGELSGSLLAA